MSEIDPAWPLLPQDQIERVMRQEECDIEPAFLGFTEVYQALASIIPHHWTIVDLGCAYAPQVVFFARHRAYIGVDFSGFERFTGPNVTHYRMPIEQFVTEKAREFDQRTTFAICSYVPPWSGDNMAFARAAFRNVFTYYPAKDPDKPSPFAGWKHSKAAERIAP